MISECWPERDTPLSVEDDDGIQYVTECNACPAILVLAFWPGVGGVLCDDCAAGWLQDHGLAQ